MWTAQIGLRFSFWTFLFYFTSMVDVLLITGRQDEVIAFLRHSNWRFKYGTVIFSPGVLQCFSLKFLQENDISSRIDGDGKRNAILAHTSTLERRSQPEDTLNVVERSACMSSSTFFNCLGVTMRPLCSFYSSYLQQFLLENKVSLLSLQCNILRRIKTGKDDLLIRYTPILHSQCLGFGFCWFQTFRILWETEPYNRFIARSPCKGFQLLRFIMVALLIKAPCVLHCYCWDPS